MSYVPGVNDVIELRIFCAQGSQVSCNVSHWLVTAVPGPGLNLASITNKFFALFAPLYTASMSTTKALFYGVSCAKIAPGPKTPSEHSTTAPAAGLDAGAPLPSQVRGMLSLAATTAGPGGRGRQYIPFPTVTFSDADGHPTGAMLGNMDVIGNAMITPQTFTVGIFSSVLTPVLLNRTTGATQNIATRTSRSRWATQKRSGDYGRQNTLPW